MTAAYRLKGLGWFASVVVIALACYLVSLKVAGERKALTDMDGQIVAAHRDLRNLETEFNSRANLAQLERWNGDVLALTAPGADQYLPSEAKLAQISFNGPAPAMPQVETAAYIVPQAPVNYDPSAIAAQQAARTNAAAALPTPAVLKTPVEPRSATTLRVATALLVKASVLPARPQTIAAAASVPVGRAISAPRKPQAMAALDRKLLSDRTLGDLLSGAHAETAPLR